MRKDWDAVVIGSGPAGSTAARLLAERGWQVLILEKRKIPRDKACGDGLIPDSLHFLRASGLHARIAAIGTASKRVRIFSPRRFSFSVDGEFICVPRLQLDKILLDAAIEAGAVLQEGNVRSVASAGPLSARLDMGVDVPVINAKIAVIATGADVHLAKSLGLVTRERESAVAYRGYIRTTKPLDELIVSFDRSIIPGYAWIFPVGQNRCNVGCGVFHGSAKAVVPDLRAMLADFLTNFPTALEHFGEGASERVEGARGARLRCNLDGVEPTDGMSVLVTGETIGTTFAFTGEGIGKAMESAALAAQVANDVLRSSDSSLLAGYSKLLNSQLRPKYSSYRTAERWLSTAWLNDFLSWRVSHSPFLQRSLAGILDESTDPSAVFSPSGVVRAIFT